MISPKKYEHEDLKETFIHFIENTFKSQIENYNF